MKTSQYYLSLPKNFITLLLLLFAVLVTPLLRADLDLSGSSGSSSSNNSNSNDVTTQPNDDPSDTSDASNLSFITLSDLILKRDPESIHWGSNSELTISSTLGAAILNELGATNDISGLRIDHMKNNYKNYFVAAETYYLIDHPTYNPEKASDEERHQAQEEMLQETINIESKSFLTHDVYSHQVYPYNLYTEKMDPYFVASFTNPTTDLDELDQPNFISFQIKSGMEHRNIKLSHFFASANAFPMVVDTSDPYQFECSITTDQTSYFKLSYKRKESFPPAAIEKGSQNQNSHDEVSWNNPETDSAIHVAMDISFDPKTQMLTSVSQEKIIIHLPNATPGTNHTWKASGSSDSNDVTIEESDGKEEDSSGSGGTTPIVWNSPSKTPSALTSAGNSPR